MPMFLLPPMAITPAVTCIFLRNVRACIEAPPKAGPLLLSTCTAKRKHRARGERAGQTQQWRKRQLVAVSLRRKRSAGQYPIA